MLSCSLCGLGTEPQVPGTGPERTRYAVIGEAPGATEIARRAPFVGRSGILLMSVLNQVGLKREDVYLDNACMCRPPQDVAHPTAEQARICSSRLRAEFKKRGVDRVLLLGAVALRALTGEVGITAARGRPLQGPDGIVYLPTFHPAAVLRHQANFPPFARDLEKFAQTENLASAQAEWTWRLTKNELDAAAVVSKLTGPVVLDIETSGYSMFDDEILCLVLAFGDEPTIVVIPHQQLVNIHVLRAFHAACERDDIMWIGHSFQFDARMLETRLGFRPKCGFDTLLAHYALDERSGMGIHDLKRIAADEFQAPDWEADIKKYLPHPKVDSYDMLPADVLYRYCAFDGYYTWRLWKLMDQRLKEEAATTEPGKRTVLDLFYDLLLPASEAVHNMTRNGIHIDTDKLDALHVVATETQKRAEADLRELVHDPKFNVRSPKQVKHYLYEVLGAPLYTESVIPNFVPKLTTPTAGLKADTTSIVQLERLTFSQRGDIQRFAELMIEYKQAQSLTSRYLKYWEPQEDGRIHPSYMLHGTVTGRMASAGPNVMNAPYERGVRELICAEPGNVLLALDYGQNELRVMAVLSGDEHMVKTFQAGGDIHNETTLAIWGPGYTPHDRRIAKSINFGAAYGRSAQGIADAFGLELHKAQKYLQIFTQRFPGIARWQAEQQNLAIERGYVESTMGRRRRFPFIVDDNLGRVKRQAANSPIQGDGADLLLVAIIEVDKYLYNDYGGYILLPMHDSMIVEVPEKHMMEVAKRIKETMQEASRIVYGPDVPIPWVVDIDWCYAWEIDMKRLEV